MDSDSTYIYVLQLAIKDRDEKIRKLQERIIELEKQLGLTVHAK